MATNYKNSGDVVSVPALEDVVSGQAVSIGSLVGIAMFDALTGELCTFALKGVWEVPHTGAAIAVGVPLSFDPATGEFSGSPAAVDSFDNAAVSFSVPADGLVYASINIHFSTLKTA